MDNKKLKTYIMLVLAVIIWGYAGFSFFRTFSDKKNQDISTDYHISADNSNSGLADTFMLLSNYQDPFLGRSLARSTSSLQAPVRTRPAVLKKEEVKPAVITDFSFISFIGMVINPGTGKRVALVDLKGRQHMVSEGEQIEQVTFVKCFSDSIKVSYHDETKFIKRR
jgi:hypothetical protein